MKANSFSLASFLCVIACECLRFSTDGTWSQSSEVITGKASDFIQAAAAKNVSVCMTTEGSYGGLSNTWGLVNHVWHFAKQSGVRFLWPHTTHDGIWKMTEVVHSNRIAKCGVRGQGAACVYRFLRPSLGGCEHSKAIFMRPNVQKVQPAAVWDLPATELDDSLAHSSCACPYTLVFPISVKNSKRWNVPTFMNYNETWEEMRQVYENEHPRAATGLTQDKITVAVHIRLGDVSDRGRVTALELEKDQEEDLENVAAALEREMNEEEEFEDVQNKKPPWKQVAKAMAPEYYVDALSKILFGEGGLPAQCAEVRLLTNPGSEHHGDVKLVMDGCNSTGAQCYVGGPLVRKRGERAEDRDFEVMVSSDVLIAGTSGFGHFAANLKHDGRLTIAPPTGTAHKGGDSWHNDLEYLPHVYRGRSVDGLRVLPAFRGLLEKAERLKKEGKC